MLCLFLFILLKFEYFDWYLCVVFENGILFGVVFIDVLVSFIDLDIIKKKYVDLNVFFMRLVC